MNTKSQLGLVATFAASLVLHASGMIAAVPMSEPLQLEAAAPGVALLGNSFADMAMAVPSTPPVTRSTTPVTDASLTPTVTAPVVPTVAPTVTGTLPVAPSATVTATTPVAPETTVPAEPASEATPPDTTPPEETPDQDTPAVQTPDSATLRPQQRPSNLGQTPPTPTPEPREQVAKSGNATENARQGTASGQQSGNATAASNGASTTTANQGNARAIANYPSQVMRRISRTRRERVNVSGAATVAFSLGASGAVTSVSIARSSGNAQIDQVAISHIQRSAPFPVPPQGAQTSFSVEIKTR